MYSETKKVMEVESFHVRQRTLKTPLCKGRSYMLMGSEKKLIKYTQEVVINFRKFSMLDD